MKTIESPTTLIIASVFISLNVYVASGFTSPKAFEQRIHSWQNSSPERCRIDYTNPSTRTKFSRGIITQTTKTKTKLPSLLTASTEQENNDATFESSLPPTEPSEMIVKFKSYATNIARTRNITNDIKVKYASTSKQKPKHHRSENHGKLRMASKPSPASMSAIRSLLYTLQSESQALLSVSKSLNGLFVSRDVASQIYQSMNYALIQAIRGAADHGDYAMISKIVEAAIAYAELSLKVHHLDLEQNSAEEETRTELFILEARVFGEAISGMSRTKASHSKLKRLWSLFIDLTSKYNHEGEINSLTMITKPSAFELNAMITGMGNRGKFRAALNLYEEMTEADVTGSMTIEGDRYTASALFKMLANSISSDDRPIVYGNSSSSQSPCWQWNEALSILDKFEEKIELNNQVYATLMKVNEQAMELYRLPDHRHPGAKCAMSILERMQKKKISPDVVTCSAVMSAFHKGKQWKAALALLRAMEKSEPEDDVPTPQDGPGWLLPKPNVYIYTSVIASCARSGQYEEAMTLLDDIRGTSYGKNVENEDSEDKGSNRVTVGNDISPNTWLYNAALAACAPNPHDVKKNDQLLFDTAAGIFRRMQEDAAEGYDTLPDKVSYNTLLSSIEAIGSDTVIANSTLDMSEFHDLTLESDNVHEVIAMRVIETMKEKGISRDPGTYRNAIAACKSNPESAIRVLDKALEDPDIAHTVNAEWVSPQIVILYLANEVLSVCASKGNMNIASKVFTYIKKYNLKADSKTMLSLVKAISTSGNCEDSMIALNAMKGDGAANGQFIEKYGINIIESGIDIDDPMVEEQHYAAAITGCLRDGQLFPALKILNAMKLHELKPNENSLQGIIMAYCKLATDEATAEFKLSRREYSKGKIKGPAFRANHSTSRTRASAALAMMGTMKNPPIKLQCVVGSACAASGMWHEAREILWTLHIAAILEKKRDMHFEAIDLDQGSAIAELPKLHRSLLKLCARSGNVTASLWYVDAIQDLSSKFERRAYSAPLSQGDANFSDEIEVFDKWSSETSLITSPKYGIGMTGEDWKLLMIAASKSSHWRICLGTLPFIQPYVEATHPQFVSPEKGKAPSMKSLNKKYDNLARALTAAVLAFETRSQYAWAIRAIDDWIEWSGRRPAKEAVFAACRILAARNVGNELVQLVTKVTRIPDRSKRRKTKRHTYESSYEMAVYVEAITASYKRGLYDSADELYVNAISKGFLDVASIKQTAESQFKIDLHGMNRVIAHSAVRVSLQHLIQSASIDKLDKDILIVTGKGKRSARHLRPVLRPEVQTMLMEEFYPPIGTSSVPNNMGALRISSDDANAWIEHQQQQKGVRFLAVADALKTITTGERLKKLLSQRVQTDQ